MALQNKITSHNVEFGHLEKARKKVLIVAPLNPNRDPEELVTRSYEISGPEGRRNHIYDKFAAEIRPMLAEVTHDEELSLRKLVIPTQEGMSENQYRSQFLVNRENYFFRRGATRSEHPFWKNQGFVDGNEGTDWLGAHRGKNYVVQMRRKLEELCNFQSRNEELLNAFMKFMTRFSSQEGLNAITLDTGYPEGLAERLLDYFYTGDIDADIDLAGIQWEAQDKNGRTLAKFDQSGQLEQSGAESDSKPLVCKTVTRLADAFLRVLLKENPDGATRIGGKLPYAEAKSLEDVTRLKEDFCRARSALSAILQMLPCQVLAQESLAWLFDELFAAVIPDGQSKPESTEDYRKIGEAVNTNGDTRLGKIRTPAHAALDMKTRIALKQTIFERFEDVLDSLFENAEIPAELPTEIAELIGNLRSDDAFMESLRAMIPAEGVDSETVAAMRKGTKRLMRTLFLSKVAPRMFNVPIFERKELQELLKSYEVSCMLTATAMAESAGGGTESLETQLRTVGESVASSIDDALKDDENLGGSAMESVAAVSIEQTLKTVAAAAGSRIQRQTELWQAAQKALAVVEEPSVEQVISGLRALRSEEKDGQSTATRNSRVQVDERMIAAMARETISRNREVARILSELPESESRVERSEEEVAKVQVRLGQAEAKLAELVNVGETADGGGDGALDAARKEVSIAKDAEAEAGSELESARLAHRNVSEQKNNIVGAVSTSDQEDSGPDNLDVRSTVDAVLGELGLGLPASEKLKTDGDIGSVGARLNEIQDESALESRVADVVREWRDRSGNRESTESLLVALENQNHEIYRRYSVDRSNSSMVSYRRQVEAMVLGRIMLSLGDRVGLGMKSSGLMRCVIDLLEKTGQENPESISGMEVLREVSLHSYVDGGNLADGQQIQNLRDKLRDCARESFENIKGFVSELHGMYYLFQIAPTGSVIQVANGSAQEIRLWIDRENLRVARPDGNATERPWGVISAENRRAGRILDRPGLMHLSALSFESDDWCSELSRWNGIALSRNNMKCVVPPLLLSARTASADESGNWDDEAKQWDETLREGAPFPWLIVGPSNILNTRQDREFATHLPAAYPLLGRFLGCPTSDIQSDAFGVQRVGGRVRSVSGHEQGVDQAILDAIEETSIGPNDVSHSFTCDYFLYLVLILLGDLKGANESETDVLDELWDNPKTSGNWLKFARLIGADNVKFQKCLPYGDPLRYRFSDVPKIAAKNFAPVVEVTESSGGGERREVGTIKSTEWFAAAYRQMFEN